MRYLKQPHPERQRPVHAANYAAESQVLAMPCRLLRSGSSDSRALYRYGYSFALNPAKTVTSLTLPKTRKVIVLAVDLR